MVARIFVLALVTSGLLAAAPRDGAAAHRLEVTELLVTHEGRPAASVPAGARVAIECRYLVDRDRGFLRPLLAWSGDLSVAGRSLRVFPGEVESGRYVVRAEWLAETAGAVTVLCRLDRASALRDVTGDRVREVALRVTPGVGQVVECPARLTAGITATAAGARQGQGSVALTLSSSRPDANVAACFYASPNQDVRDFRVEFPCPEARRAGSTSTTITDGTSNTIVTGETPGPAAHRYLCRAR